MLPIKQFKPHHLSPGNISRSRSPFTFITLPTTRSVPAARRGHADAPTSKQSLADPSAQLGPSLLACALAPLALAFAWPANHDRLPSVRALFLSHPLLGLPKLMRRYSAETSLLPPSLAAGGCNLKTFVLQPGRSLPHRRQHPHYHTHLTSKSMLFTHSAITCLQQHHATYYVEIGRAHV